MQSLFARRSFSSDELPWQKSFIRPNLTQFSVVTTCILQCKPHSRHFRQVAISGVHTLAIFCGKRLDLLDNVDSMIQTPVS